MRKRKVQWLAAACVFCLAQPVWAATESTTVYQDQLDSVDQSYLGEISKASTPENSNIRVVRRGEKAKSDQPTEQCRLVLMQIKCPILGPLVMYMHKVM
ncbi:MAG: hypothetical protein E7G82_09440 [Veillonella sp.]|nr:hypothetical protein [Veillonella sp.]